MMATKKLPREAFVFWSYDLYPFVLGDKATLEDGGRYYRLHSYRGCVGASELIAIHTLERGAEIKTELERLRAVHTEATSALLLGFMGKAHNVLPELAKWRKAQGRTP